MKKMKRLIINLLVLSCIFVTAFMLMGIDVPDGVSPPDGYPNGCVDCHTDDYSLNILTADEEHPDVSMIVQQVPDGCTMCHKEGAAGGALSSIIHEEHDINVDVGLNEECLSCHTYDSSDGTMLNKSGAKNW